MTSPDEALADITKHKNPIKTDLISHNLQHIITPKDTEQDTSSSNSWVQYMQHQKPTVLVKSVFRARLFAYSKSLAKQVARETVQHHHDTVGKKISLFVQTVSGEHVFVSYSCIYLSE